MARCQRQLLRRQRWREEARCRGGSAARSWRRQPAQYQSHTTSVQQMSLRGRCQMESSL